MARLHLAFREEAFDPRIIELSRRFVQVRPWSLQKRRKFETWLHGANIVYELEDVHLAKVPKKAPHGAVGSYDPETRTIKLARWSIISLFHQYRHHMQASADPKWQHTELDTDGQDAQQWACSLMYIIAPRTFRRAVRADRVAGVHPEDLLRRRKNGRN